MGAWGVLWICNLQIILSFIKNVPSGDVLGLAGYTQSSGTGDLNEKTNLINLSPCSCSIPSLWNLWCQLLTSLDKGCEIITIDRPLIGLYLQSKIEGSLGKDSVQGTTHRFCLDKPCPWASILFFSSSDKESDICRTASK